MGQEYYEKVFQTHTQVNYDHFLIGGQCLWPIVFYSNLVKDPILHNLKGKSFSVSEDTDVFHTSQTLNIKAS